MVMVFIWHQHMPGHNQSELFRNVIDRAKDLLTTLHSRVVEAEQRLQERMDQQQSLTQLAITSGEANAQASLGSIIKKVSKRNFDSVYDLRDRLVSQKGKVKGSGNDLVTKVYPSDVIPDTVGLKKSNYRPNNFMAGEISTVQGSSIMRQNNRASNSRLLMSEQ